MQGEGVRDYSFEGCIPEAQDSLLFYPLALAERSVNVSYFFSGGWGGDCKCKAYGENPVLERLRCREICALNIGVSRFGVGSGSVTFSGADTKSIS